MITKIQINSLDALERLIGGDTELEIEVRNSVIQKFAEKHLKPLANSSAFKKIEDQLRKDAADQLSGDIATFKRDWQGYVSDIKLRPEIKDEMSRQVRTMIDDKIREAVTEAVTFWANEKEVEDRITKRMAYYTDELIKDEVRKRIEELKKKL